MYQILLPYSTDLDVWSGVAGRSEERGQKMKRQWTVSNQ